MSLQQHAGLCTVNQFGNIVNKWGLGNSKLIFTSVTPISCPRWTLPLFLSWLLIICRSPPRKVFEIWIVPHYRHDDGPYGDEQGMEDILERLYHLLFQNGGEGVRLGGLQVPGIGKNWFQNLSVLQVTLGIWQTLSEYDYCLLLLML